MSAYHCNTHEKQGQEKTTTYYHRKDKTSPYHIDVLFASEIFLDELESIEIGSYEEWIEFSDHMPISAEFNRRKIIL